MWQHLYCTNHLPMLLDMIDSNLFPRERNIFFLENFFLLVHFLPDGHFGDLDQYRIIFTGVGQTQWNTPGTRVGPGFCNRKLAKKCRKNSRKSAFVKVGENNGQLRFVRHHVWRTQARLDQWKICFQ